MLRRNFLLRTRYTYMLSVEFLMPNANTTTWRTQRTYRTDQVVSGAKDDRDNAAVGEEDTTANRHTLTVILYDAGRKRIVL